MSSIEIWLSLKIVAPSMPFLRTVYGEILVVDFSTRYITGAPSSDTVASVNTLYSPALTWSSDFSATRVKQLFWKL